MPSSRRGALLDTPDSNNSRLHNSRLLDKPLWPPTSSGLRAFLRLDTGTKNAGNISDFLDGKPALNIGVKFL